MTICELYNKNIRLQYISDVIVKSVYRQNYDRALRNLKQFTAELSLYMNGCMENTETIGIDISDFGLADFLVNIMNAQKADDYILIADLIQMQMIPFLLSVQESVRNFCDVMFCQEIWEENIVRLREKSPKLAALIEKEQEKWFAAENPEYWLEPTNSGLFTLASSDDKGVYYFHSNWNPQLEAVEFANYYYDMTCANYIVLGFGLGYHCEALANMDEDICINIYENDLSVVVQAMMANNLGWLWNNENVNIIYDNDFSTMSKELSKTDVEDKVFVIHHPSLRHIKNSDIKAKLEHIFIRDSGIRNQRALMESNFNSNIRNKTDVIDVLKERFDGKHGIIVAAGPSLDNNVEQLLNKPDNTLIIATGTVFRKLISLGVEVDYVIVADANRRIFGQLAGNLDSMVPLLYLSTAYKGFAEKYKGDKYVILQRDHNLAMEEARRLGVDTYGTGGSVSTTALDVCISLGCASIAFIGLDLAYTGNFAHATGTSRRVANDVYDMQKVPGYEISDSTDGAAYEVKKVELTSSNLFDMYRNWIEKRVKEKDVKIPIYDATEGGSFINGMKIVTLKEYFELMDKEIGII